MQGSSASVTVPGSATSGKTFKSYVVTNTKYTDSHFGTNYVIEVAGNNTGTDDRFIAMALNDVDVNNHIWWNWFYSNSSSLGTSYEIGAGKTNTETVKVAWNANTSGQNTNGTYTDIWSLVTLDANNKATWFIPSNDEWKAFGAMSWTDNGTTPTARSITGGTNGSGGNYGDQGFGLANYYWSSSQNTSFNNFAQGTTFSYSRMNFDSMNSSDCRVRLSTTF